MGAWVALLAAAAHPELFTRLVLIDGGVSAPLPPDADPDAVLRATLGPAIARLGRTFATDEEYLDVFRAHPAFTEWNPDIEAYVRYDLAGEPGALRSRVGGEAAVRQDGREILVRIDRLRRGLERALPTHTADHGAQGTVRTATRPPGRRGGGRGAAPPPGHPSGDDPLCATTTPSH